MKKLAISKDFSLPHDAVTSTIVVYGGKGMGKTNMGSVLVEELTKANLRWCVLDPMGVWWGLRHSADGKGPGIECVILGGAHGDIPIEPTGGAVIADLVVDENANTIIDFSRKANGQMWTVGEKIRFVTEYTLRLFQRQGELVNGRRREPMMQLLDESARYIPQVIPSGSIDLAKCVGAWEQVCEEGRNIGLGVTFLTQRSARMNKSVSELADVMLAFRTVGPNSLRAVMDWLGEHVEKTRVRELAEKVRSLDIGQALVVSPGWLKVEKVATIRMRETFDSSSTPKPGQQQKRITGKASKPNLAKYQERMAETIEKAKAEDPKELKKEITRLTHELSNNKPNVQKVDAIGQATAIEAAVALAIKKRDIEWKKSGELTARETDAYTKRMIAEWKTRVAQVAAEGNREIKRLAAIIGKVASTIGAENNGVTAVLSSSAVEISPPPASIVSPPVKLSSGPVATEEKRQHAPVPPERRTFDSSSAHQEGEVKLSKAATAVLSYLHSVYPTSKTKTQMWVATGYSPGGGFDNAVYELTGRGLIANEGGKYVSTETHDSTLVNDFVASLDTYKAKIGLGARKVFEVLLQDPDTPRTKADLAAETGYAMGGGFDNNIYALTGPALVKRVEGGYVVNPQVLDLS